MLKLVHDAKVAELPIGNLQDLPGMLRLLADDIAEGLHGDVVSLVTLIVHAGGIGITTYGENCSAYELMGLFEAAKFRVIADDCVED